MKFILKSGEEITVKKDYPLYNISDEDKQDLLNYYTIYPPVMAGTYAFKEVNWTCIINIVKNYLYTRQVAEVIPEDGEIIEELPFEEGIIY